MQFRSYWRVMKQKIAIFVLIGIALGSFVLGAQIGTTVHEYGMAQYKAAVDYRYIKELDHDPQGLRVALDDDLDSELILFGEYRKSPWTWLFPDLRARGDKYARQMALYRLQNPHKLQFPDFPPDTDPDLVAYFKANYQDREAALQRILAVYGSTTQQSVPAAASQQPTHR